MSWEDECRISLNNIKRLLPRFFDPLEDFTAPEYFELARSLLELYRCYRPLRLENWKLEEIDDTLMMLKGLIELSAKIVIEKYRSHEYREKLKESLKTLGESEVKNVKRVSQTRASAYWLQLNTSSTLPLGQLVYTISGLSIKNISIYGCWSEEILG